MEESGDERGVVRGAREKAEGEQEHESGEEETVHQPVKDGSVRAQPSRSEATEKGGERCGEKRQWGNDPVGIRVEIRADGGHQNQGGSDGEGNEKNA